MEEQERETTSFKKYMLPRELPKSVCTYKKIFAYSKYDMH